MSFRQNTKRIFTAALVFWMSGAIVLFCCGTMPTRAAETESCPLAKKGNCTKTVKKNSENFFGFETTAVDCCAAPTKIFDKNRKIEKSLEPAVITKASEIVSPENFSIQKVSGSSVYYQPFVCNRSGTYLRNCVFRN